MHIQKIEGDRMELELIENGAVIPIKLLEYDFFKTLPPGSGGLRHFKTKQGIPARVQLSADGRLRGWFALDSGPVQITFDQTSNTTSTSLLQAYPAPRQTALTQQQRSWVWQANPNEQRMIEEIPPGNSTELVKVLHEEVDVPTAYGVAASSPLLNDNEMPDANNWQGTPWFGGSTPCYPDDSSGPWIMKVGIMVDGKAVQDESWEERVSAMVSAGSIIYEKQMNIMLEVGWTITANDGSNSAIPLFDETCPLWDAASEQQSLVNQLQALQAILSNPGGSGTTLTEDQRNAVVVTHLFTGCDDNGHGTVGLAGIGTLGDSTSAGVDNFKSSWQTFAHELGHNFGAGHTFTNGGGIMDYDNGKTGGTDTTIGVGVFEFNPLRKCEVCSELSELRRSGHAGFTRETGSTPSAAGNNNIAAGCVCEDAASTGYTYNGGQTVTCSIAQSYNWCSYVMQKCPVTCGLCTPDGSTPTPAPTPTPTPPPASGGCSDVSVATWSAPCFNFCSGKGASASASGWNGVYTVTCTCGDNSVCTYTAQ